MKYRILLKILIGIIGSFILMIIGGIFGAFIGGNFGFISFGDKVRYEAGGAFFAILGIILGAWFGVGVIKKRLHEKNNFQKGIFISLILMLIFLIFFNRDINNLFYFYLIIPAFIFTFLLR